MVIFLTLPEGAGHIDAFYTRFGARARRRIAEITYHELLRRGQAPAGAYVFTDRERMSMPQRQIAAAIWDQLRAGGDAFRTYNHPLRQLGRFELLQKLHEIGTNRFNAYLLDDLPTDIRYPVFLRQENDHNGPRTGLLPDKGELTREADRLILQGLHPENLLVVEFEDVSDHAGISQKRGVLRAGSVTVGNHIYSTESWVGKSDHANKTPEMRAASDRFFRNHPDHELVMPLFELAGIDYGRIDYTVIGSSVQVWEINDNPSYQGGHREHGDLRGHAWMQAIESLGANMPVGQSVRVSLEKTDLWELIKA